ncbi:choline transporter-like protein 1 [Pollicipes pollicipes]|uniref:choline transporter-like protein 1 n=1 Tax=Pollicipes pollicipes TaxID=41117 RepID=UPI001885492C|nr:choline transporter-like protein 1 [Pollicipes pollicipes]
MRVSFCRIVLVHSDISDAQKGQAVLDFGLDVFHLMNRTCVSECPSEGGELVVNYCFYSPPSPGGPTVSSQATMEASSFFDELSRDLEKAWQELLAICAVALGLALVLLATLRFLAWMIVYVVIAVMVVGALAGTGLLWYLYFEAKKAADNAHESIREFRVRDANSMLAFAVVATIATLLLLILLVVMRKRIKLVTALFKEAGKAVQAMPLMLLQPLVTFVVMAITVCVWVATALVIESMGTPVPGLHSGFVQYRKTGAGLFFRWYNMFALFWVSQFIIACQDMVVGGAVSKWFFTRDKSQLGNPVLLATKNLVLYHLGSVALGSFIIAVVKMIRYILKKIQAQMGNNPVAKIVCCCCQCCLYCFTKFLQFLNRNAYVEITIHGYNFCKAAQQAFGILARNALRVAAINSIGSFVLFLGKLSVTVSTVFIGIEIMKGRPDVKHSYILIAIGGLFAYIISYVFISIYEMAIDALFICFCEDCDINDGVERPYFMSKGLMEFVENSKTALAALKYKPEPNNNQPPLFVKSPGAPGSDS